MTEKSIADIREADLRHPVPLGDRVWWVGHHQQDDVFQCHVYLIEQGDQSVLLDPGSNLTFGRTLEKIEEIIPFSCIRYFVCHHQDPDIAAALPTVDSMVSRPDAVLVTHWRAQMLLKHYGLKLPFWLVEEHDWRLVLEDRELSFIFTPYAHFPGAFCTFDGRSQVLFSSDLFGGFTREPVLFARQAEHFEAIRPFHEHYMPSRDVLRYALSRIEQHPVRVIAPQHGCVIPEPLVAPMIDRLKSLDCGLYLLARESTDIQRLSKLNQALQDITQAMLSRRDFSDIAERLLQIVGTLLPITSLEFYLRLDNGEVVHLSHESGFRGTVVIPSPEIAAILLGGVDGSLREPLMSKAQASSEVRLPLVSPQARQPRAVAVLRFEQPHQNKDEFQQIIEQMRVPLQAAVEREAMYRLMERERQQFYERSIRDPLTGLFSRLYMQDVTQRMCSLHDRDSHAAVAVVMADIDHFKAINDTYGHQQGDEVLRRVAQVLGEGARGSDLAVRLGGEEFAVFVVGESARGVEKLAERMRSRVSCLKLEGPLAACRVTVSLGTAIRRQGESFAAFLARADAALYQAKRSGRDQVRASAC